MGLTVSLAPTAERSPGFFFQRRFCARLIFARVSSGMDSPLFQGGFRPLLGCPANTCRHELAAVHDPHLMRSAI